MTWNQDAISYPASHWIGFPLSIRMQLVREGQPAYNLPVSRDRYEDDDAIFVEENRNPTSVDGIRGTLCLLVP